MQDMHVYVYVYMDSYVITKINTVGISHVTLGIGKSKFHREGDKLGIVKKVMMNSPEEAG